MKTIPITDRISYIPSTEKPLSSEVGIVRGDSFTYLYDVGSTPENLEFITGLEGKCDIVVSHFHGDHAWWLVPHHRGEDGVEDDDTISLTYKRPEARNIYIGAYTAKYIRDAVVVDENVVITDGVRLEIMNLPASHCKGGLLLMVDNEYAFLGDATYCMQKNGIQVYNAQLLKEEIELLKKIPAEKCLLSHDKRFVRDKKVVLRQLEAIYSRRTPDSPYIQAG